MHSGGDAGYAINKNSPHQPKDGHDDDDDDDDVTDGR